MKTLQTYLECGEACATPANTMGMGNPGETGPDTLSEPIGGIEKTAKSEVEKDKKKRKRKIKSLSESLFNDDLITHDISKFGSMFKLDSIKTEDSLYKPSQREMVKMNSKPENMYKINLISKDSGQKVSKDLRSIANALAAIVEKIQITADTINLSLYEFSQTFLKPLRRYYSSAAGNGYLRMVADIFAHSPNRTIDDKLIDMDEVDIHFLNINLHYRRV